MTQILLAAIGAGVGLLWLNAILSFLGRGSTWESWFRFWVAAWATLAGLMIIRILEL